MSLEDFFATWKFKELTQFPILCRKYEFGNHVIIMWMFVFQCLRFLRVSPGQFLNAVFYVIHPQF